ncbi:MAG: hypothetical protein I8H70_02500 [Burkholderiales bacterium]|nr:hypothetical protein [Burkholderiales bacterium]
MSWLERLKKLELDRGITRQAVPESVKPEPPKPAAMAAVHKLTAAKPNPDRWCWPHSQAMTNKEISTFENRANLFNRRGMAAVNAERLASKLTDRDRQDDERRLCLECAHMGGQHGAWRCNQWQRAGMGATGIPAGLVLVLQRCDGFKETR